MTDETGFGEQAAQAAVENITDGGVTIHLCTQSVAYGDDSADIDSKSDAQEDVAEGDLTINAATGFDDAQTLELAADVAYGSLDIGTVEDVVIQNQADGDLWILADEENSPELTGEEYTIESGEILHELGHIA